MKELHLVHPVKTKRGYISAIRWVDKEQTWDWKDGFCVVTTTEGTYRVPATGVKYEFAAAKKETKAA